MLWFLTDNLGTVRDIIDTNGNLVQHYRYDAFGQLLDNPTILTRYLYTGREFDVDTKLQYNRNRWYDAKTGRWLSEDPIGFEGGDYNLYRYVGNDPTNQTDPSGLDPTVYGPPWQTGVYVPPTQPPTGKSFASYLHDWWEYFWPTAVDGAGEVIGSKLPVGTIAGGLECVGEMFQKDNVLNTLKALRDRQPEGSPSWKEYNAMYQKALQKVEDAKKKKSRL